MKIGEREMTFAVRGGASSRATLAWTRWRHDDRSEVATRWRDLPASARYYRAIRRSITTGGCFLRRRGRRVGTEPARVGSDVVVFDIVFDIVFVLIVIEKRRSVFRIGNSFRPFSSSVKSLLTGNFSPVFGVTVFRV